MSASTGGRRSRRPGAAAVASVLLLVLVAAGCTVSQPSAGDWRSTAQRSLEDASSAVTTARFALREERAGRIWHHYAVILLAEAEMQAGTAGDSVTTLQRPAEVSAAQAGRVTDLLSRAEDVVIAARERSVAGGRLTDALLDELDRVAERLTAAAEGIR